MVVQRSDHLEERKGEGWRRVSLALRSGGGQGKGWGERGRPP